MMYGVSMSKDGTSKVVAQRLDEPGDARRPSGSSAGPSPSWCRSPTPFASLGAVAVLVRRACVVRRARCGVVPARRASRRARRDRGRRDRPATADRRPPAPPDAAGGLGRPGSRALFAGRARGRGRVERARGAARQGRRRPDDGRADRGRPARSGTSRATTPSRCSRRRWSDDPRATTRRCDLPEDRLGVVLVVGVNGSGKTTTIGKLAARLAEAGQEGEPGRQRHVPRGGLGAARRVGRAGGRPARHARSAAPTRERSRSTP